MFIFNLENNIIATINKLTHYSIETNKSIYLIRENYAYSKGKFIYIITNSLLH